ncbi:MAG: hypothetical protein ABIS45_11275 [Burkholderiales bacterium]
MSTIGWLVAGAVGVVIAYLAVMRVFFDRSREADKHIDYSKIRDVKDDD